MKTMKVFIASSSELKQERMELVDLIQDMNDELETKNIKIKPVLWEYMDSSMRAERKESEYLEKLHECEICIVLFWQILGEYTVEELDDAIQEMRAERCPKEVYVYFKEPAENASKELVSFKENFYGKYQVNPNTFNNAESIREQVEDLLQKYNNK